MYIAIDIGGTKTLVALFDRSGTMQEHIRFLTPPDYRLFIRQLAQTVAQLSTKDVSMACVAFPGRVNRPRGIGVACGNLPWRNVPIRDDVARMLHCQVTVENDANLAGLSEAIIVRDKYDRVLYITVSTGIGTGFIIDQEIDPDFADTEGGHIVLEHHGRRKQWEKFASGSAIVRRFGKRAQDIQDEKTWRIIARDLSIGIIDLIAILQPDVIVLGGGVSNYYNRFAAYLKEDLAKYDTPLTPVPPIRHAKHEDEAVVFGCYYLAKSIHERTRTKTPN